MKVTKIFRYGSARWRVNVPKGETGKRQRLYFKSEAEAKAFVQEKRADKETLGVQFSSLTPYQRAEILIQLQRLTVNGWTLRGAVDFILTQPKPGSAVPLEKAAADFFLSKETAELRPRYMKALRSTLKMFLIGRREIPAPEITATHIEGFLNGNGWGAATRRTRLTDLQTFFAWCVRRNVCRDNPAKSVERPRLDNKPPGILTVEQCRTLLDTTRSHEPTFLAFVVVCLFAGIRPEEARRMTWDDIGLDHIEVTAKKSKTRRRRLVTIHPALRAWLDVSKESSGQMPVRNYAKKFNAVRAASGLLAKWPHDGMRHSFCSYALTHWQSAARVALEAGHSEQMLFGHYRELVSKTSAEAFFGLLPGPAVDASPRPASRRGTRGVPLVTLDMLRELFRDGQRGPVARQQLVREIKARGVSESVAYAALRAGSAASEYWDETDGGLCLKIVQGHGDADAPSRVDAGTCDGILDSHTRCDTSLNGNPMMPFLG